MLQWSLILQRPALFREVERVYSEQGLPIEVRSSLHEYLESQPWDSWDADNPADEQAAANLLSETLKKLHSKMRDLSGEDCLLLRTRLEQACANFQRDFQHNPRGFLGKMKHCLKQEALLLQSLIAQGQECQMGAGGMLHMGGISRDQQIRNLMQELHSARQTIEYKLPMLQNNQRLLADWQKLQTLTGAVKLMESSHQTLQEKLGRGQAEGRMEPQALEELQAVQAMETQHSKDRDSLQACIHTAIQRRQEQLELYRRSLVLVQQLMELVVEELNVWKQRQQRGSNGQLPPLSDLTKLQDMCEYVVEVLELLKHQITQLEVPLLPASQLSVVPGAESFRPLLDDIYRLYYRLVYNTLVLVGQPPQVILQHSYFTASLCLLPVRKLNLPAPLPTVRALVLSAGEARQWQREGRVEITETHCLTLQHSQVAMEIDKSEYCPLRDGTLFAQFKMQLDGIKDLKRRNKDKVARIKFCFLFETSFSLDCAELKSQVLSLPVVLVVHGSQKRQAAATILWDNAFPKPNRELFEVEDKVLWDKLASELDTTCRCITNQPLSPSHLRLLASKLMGTHWNSSNNSYVSFAEFCENILPNHPCREEEKEKKSGKKSKSRCTFWDWLFDALLLIKNHLQELWDDRLIEGFISRNQAVERLMGQDVGTFLIRFSDSKCGTITIAFIDTAGAPPIHLEPMDSSYLQATRLADFIKTSNKLKCLYPNIPKHTAFSKYYSQPKQPDPQARYHSASFATDAACDTVGIDTDWPTISAHGLLTDLKDIVPFSPMELQ